MLSDCNVQSIVSIKSHWWPQHFFREKRKLILIFNYYYLFGAGSSSFSLSPSSSLSPDCRVAILTQLQQVSNKSQPLRTLKWNRPLRMLSAYHVIIHRYNIIIYDVIYMISYLQSHQSNLSYSSRPGSRVLLTETHKNGDIIIINIILYNGIHALYI